MRPFFRSLLELYGGSGQGSLPDVEEKAVAVMRVMMLGLALVTLGAAPAPVPSPSVQNLAMGTLVRSSFVASGRRTVQVQAAIFPRDRVTFGVVDFPLGGPVGETVTRAFSPDVVAAVTGGYFGPGYRPNGLLEIGGSVHDPARTELSGFAGSLKDGTPVVAPTAYLATASLKDAIQAGPFIVDPGGKFGIRSDDGQHARRAVVILSDDAVGVALTSSCTLYELAEGLTQTPEAFGVDRVERALNLSGGPSAGFAVRLPNGRVEGDPERIRIRTVLTIRKRASP
jgi:phosphodiester glycosidase